MGRVNWKRFGKDVLAKRVAARQSVREAAKEYCLTHATFSRAERGKVVSAETFLILSSYLLDKNPSVYLD